MSEGPPSSPPAPNGAPAEDVAAQGGASAYRIQLPTFEGPLDLLLHLIEEHELDIRDIPIAFVAQKFVEYITLMEQLNIDVASEYLVMAATLAHIKSKMLLPAPPADQEDEEEAEVDPRAELVRRLLEYQKYKHAAEQLASFDLLGRDVFARGMPAPAVDGPAPLAGLSLFKLLDAFQSVLSRAKATVDHQIDFERFSITDRINELSDLLRVHHKLAFDELFQGQRTRIDLIITFLALLEMTRLRMVRLYQEGPLEMIYVELAVADDGSTDAAAELGSADADTGSEEAEEADDADEADELEPSDVAEDEDPEEEKDDWDLADVLGSSREPDVTADADVSPPDGWEAADDEPAPKGDDEPAPTDVDALGSGVGDPEAVGPSEALEEPQDAEELGNVTAPADAASSGEQSGTSEPSSSSDASSGAEQTSADVADEFETER